MVGQEAQELFNSQESNPSASEEARWATDFAFTEVEHVFGWLAMLETFMRKGMILREFLPRWGARIDRTSHTYLA